MRTVGAVAAAAGRTRNRVPFALVLVGLALLGCGARHRGVNGTTDSQGWELVGGGYRDTVPYGRQMNFKFEVKRSATCRVEVSVSDGQVVDEYLLTDAQMQRVLTGRRPEGPGDMIHRNQKTIKCESTESLDPGVYWLMVDNQYVDSPRPVDMKVYLKAR
ncbi:MAG: hypothetical protein AAB074_21275 [Planctomycetota bacterium]